jgi:hypothetical protein
MESELGGLSCPGSKVEDQCLAVQIPVKEAGRLERLAILQRQERFKFTISFEKIGPQWRATVSGNTHRLQEQLAKQHKAASHLHGCIFRNWSHHLEVRA